MQALLTGIAAGYGIAIPVGAIAVLIMETGIRCGFRCAAFAGAGAATADLLYAGLAVIGGAALAGPIAELDTPLRIASALVLIAIAIMGLRRARSPQADVAVTVPDRRELAATYARFVGLTVINPTTVVYFAAVIVGVGVASDMTGLDGLLFTIGAGVASLSWQLLLAGIGAFAGHRLGTTARTVAIVGGNLLILAFAVVILVR
jgi:arginine exporter protein ArgO